MPSSPLVRRSFSEERGPGAFLSLGALPKRKQDNPSRKSPVFHIPRDDDDEHSSSLEEQSPSPSPPVSLPAAVPFPRATSPPSPTSPPSTSGSSSPRPQLPRGSSTPILLSNGKPLKSSLKSSSSSPSIMTESHAQHMHLRAHSEPSSFTVQPKNVHFPEQDYGLATVRIFNRSARPAALSNPANGDETETEGEDGQPTRFPFPPSSPMFHYELDPTKSTPIPSRVSQQANLLIESVNLSPSSFPPSSAGAKPVLTGCVLVRNLAFEKHVAVRFTLDDWQTVSEVSAHYIDSQRSLPSNISCHSTDVGASPHPLDERGWDRFTFNIRLEDYSHSLSTRTLWLAARYRVSYTYPAPGSSHHGPGGEWWDNNDGGNYRVSFRAALPAAAFPSSRPRRETAPAPLATSQTRPQPPLTCKDHALGLMVPSEPSHRASPSVSSLGESHKASSPLRAGRLNLLNYAPPVARATSSITPSSDFLRPSPPPRLVTTKSPATVRTPSDDDSSSPASSALSTPSVSPTMVPRVIIGGQLATSSHLYGLTEKDEEAVHSRPSRIQDWEWSAPEKRSVDGLPRRASNPVSESPRWRNISGLPNTTRPSASQGANDSTSLYNAFVKQWCFEQGPSPNHTYVDGGILA